MQIGCANSEVTCLKRLLNNYIRKYGLEICALIPSKANNRQNWRRPQRPVLHPTPGPRKVLLAKKSTNLLADGDDADNDDDTYRTLPALRQPLQ